MNLYVIFISFFVCYFVNYSNSACMDYSSPGSSPRRPKLTGRAQSPDEELQLMDLEECFSTAVIKPRVLFADLEDADAECPELGVISDDPLKVMPFEPALAMRAIAIRSRKRAGEPLENCSKMILVEEKRVIWKAHRTEKSFPARARSISTSPKRGPRPKPSLFGTP